jgi:hypothetical protein
MGKKLGREVHEANGQAPKRGVRSHDAPHETAEAQ